MAYVYRHVRLDKNEVFYIGIGSDEEGKYGRAHSKADRNKYWRNIINKTKYEVEIMLDDLTWEEACKKEVEFIKLYGRRDLNEGTLVNMTQGGEGTLGYIATEETRKKLSVSIISSRSEEVRKKLSEAAKNRSQETRKKLSKSLKGRKLSEETKNKIREALKDRKHSEEIKKKRSESIKECHKNNSKIGFKGRKHSEDAKEKMRKPKGPMSEESKKKLSEATKLYWKNKREAS